MKKTTWSIEILPQNVSDVSFIPELIKEVYITMIPGSGFSDNILAAQKIKASGNLSINGQSIERLTTKNPLAPSTVLISSPIRSEITSSLISSFSQLLHQIMDACIASLKVGFCSFMVLLLF